jgi:hypothetical protein
VHSRARLGRFAPRCSNNNKCKKQGKVASGLLLFIFNAVSMSARAGKSRQARDRPSPGDREGRAGAERETETQREEGWWSVCRPAWWLSLDIICLNDARARGPRSHNDPCAAEILLLARYSSSVHRGSRVHHLASSTFPLGSNFIPQSTRTCVTDYPTACTMAPSPGC